MSQAARRLREDIATHQPSTSLRSFVLAAFAACLAACAPATAVKPPGALPAPGYTYAVSQTGQLLVGGTVSGFVGRYDGQAFVPATGVTVSLEGTELRAVTDVRGCYGFSGLTPGEARLSVSSAGFHPFTLICRVSRAAGTPRANLALIPLTRPENQAAGSLTIAGVLTDPRGAAVPGGTVRCVDSLSQAGAGSSLNQPADTHGLFACVLPGIAVSPLTNGQALLTAFGATPGGVAVETAAVTTTIIDSAPTQALALGTTAFVGPAGARADLAPGRTPAIVAAKLPNRRDELVLRFVQGSESIELPPLTVNGERCTFTLPKGYTLGRTTVELLNLGLVPPGQAAVTVQL